MKFRVKVVSASGGVAELPMEAADATELSRLAQLQGYDVISAQPASGWTSARLGGAQFPLTLFSHQLLVLVRSGLPLLEAIETLSAKEKRTSVGTICSQLVELLRQGQSFSRALERFPAVFPPLYVATIRASERTGDLVEALSRYLTYRTQLDAVRKRLVSAMLYPALLVFVGGLIVVFLLTYVVPRFSHVYEDMGDRLPLLSRLLMVWGKAFEAHGLWIGVLFALGLVLAGYWLSRPATLRSLLDRLRALPGVGEKLQAHQLAGFYRTLGMLLRGGIPLVTALEMAAGIVRSGLGENVARATAALSEGRPVAETFERHGLATEVSARLLRVGERSGELGPMMDNIAAYFEDETAQWLDRVTRLFEPVLMLAIGGMIGTIVLLMYMPIFELASSIR